MEKISEKLRKLVIINMVTILVAYAFCFINCTLEIPGRCTDCFTYTGLIFLVGFVVVIMQAILGASLLGIIRE